MNSYAQIKLEDQAAATAQADHRFPPAPSSDSSEWSQYSSPAPSPAVPHALARSVRGTERQRAKDEHGPFASLPYPSSYYRSPIQTPSTPILPPSSSKSRHIPRPPNAFILFRSSLVNKGKIPDNIERRQQTLSRVAGQCWNLMSPAEKREWQDLAAERAAEHQRQHPDYHFKPSPRGKGKAKLRSNEDKSDDAIRALRETYVGIRGPSILASRQRKPKPQPEEVQLNEGSQDAGASGSAPSSAPPSSVSPYDMQEAGAFDWPGFSDSNSPPLPSPASSSSNDPPVPPCFPQRTFPHFAAPRRPSTSLGFVRRPEEDTSCFQAGYTLERPASAASDTGLTTLVRDLNITPTAANFGHISMPSTPKFYGAPYSTVEQDAIRAPFPFSALNSQFTDLTSGMNTEQLSPNDPGNFMDAHFMMPLESYGLSNAAEPAFTFDNAWTFDQSMGSGQ